MDYKKCTQKTLSRTKSSNSDVRTEEVGERKTHSKARSKLFGKKEQSKTMNIAYYQISKKSSFALDFSSCGTTTVSKLIDFLPFAGNHSLEVGNNRLLFCVPEAT
jgi:hypothetical protein